MRGRKLVLLPVQVKEEAEEIDNPRMRGRKLLIVSDNIIMSGRN